MLGHCGVLGIAILYVDVCLDMKTPISPGEERHGKVGSVHKLLIARGRRCGAVPTKPSRLPALFQPWI